MLDKQVATLVGTRTLDPAQSMECESPPFEATTTPCSVSTIVQLRIGDGGLTEALVSLPRERIDAFGTDVPVRVSLARGERWGGAPTALLVFDAVQDKLLFGVVDFFFSPMDPALRFPWNSDALTIGPGAETCETIVDYCQRKLVGQELGVTALGTKRTIALGESAEVTVGADVYRIWHRSASRRVPSGSKYPECADLTSSRVSFDVALVPTALADAGSD